jgi:RNA polymerase sigma-70 factor, ECF subfamily
MQTGIEAIHGEVRLDEESEAQIRVAVFYRRYHQMLVQYLRRQARCPETAEDLAQQLWLKLLESASRGGSIPPDEPGFRAFLFTAARNLFIDECRRKHGTARTAPQPPEDIERVLAERGAHAIGVDELVANQQARALLRRAVDDLPSCQREVVGLWLEQASIASMVAATGAPRDTVLSRKKYGFRKLRDALRPLEPLCPAGSLVS